VRVRSPAGPRAGRPAWRRAVGVHVLPELQLVAMPLGEPTLDLLWRLVEEGFELSREHEIESLFAVSNGYLGARGSLPESSPLSSSGLFIAGLFHLSGDRPAIPELVAAPDPMRFQVVVDGSELTLGNGVALEHRRTLDLRQGILWRDWRHRDPAGRITR